MASITESFSGARLREIRERAGLLQRDVADLCTERGRPVTQSLISQWEGGRTSPLVPTLKVLAEALGVPLDDLLDPDRQAKAS